MILTCPSCATQYSVDAARMDRPRRVRCSACKAAWTHEPEETVEELPPESQLLGDDTPIFRPEPLPDEIVAAVAESVGEGAPVAKQIREKTKAKEVTRKAVAAGAVWGGLAAVMLLLIVCAALFRVEVVRLIPSTAGAYAKVGLTVNPVGLAPEGVEAGPGLHNGHAAVIVTGKLRNVQAHPHPAQPLRIILMDKGGRRLTDQVLAAGEHSLAPGEARPFELAFLDPPSGVAQVQVEFAFDMMHGRKPAKGHGAKAGHGEAHAAQAHDPGHGQAAHAEAGHGKAEAHAAAAHEALAQAEPAHGAEAHEALAHAAPAQAAPVHAAPAPVAPAHVAPAHVAPAQVHGPAKSAAKPHAAAHPAPVHAPPAHQAGLRGPAPPSRPAPIPAKLAKPLPGNSPYALPEAARAHAGHG